MAKQPRAKAEITGAAAKNPARHRSTPLLEGASLGEPSDFLDTEAQAAWVQFKREVPWLRESHRAVMEILCHIRGQLFRGEALKSTDVKSYMGALGKIGATPSDEGKVAAALGYNPQTPSSHDEQAGLRAAPESEDADARGYRFDA